MLLNVTGFYTCAELETHLNKKQSIMIIFHVHNFSLAGKYVSAKVSLVSIAKNIETSVVKNTCKFIDHLFHSPKFLAMNGFNRLTVNHN